jgi:nucleolar protein 4
VLHLETAARLFSTSSFLSSQERLLKERQQSTMAGASQLKRRRDEPEDVESQPAQPAQQQQNEPSSKRARVEAGRSLFVRSLPPSATDESLTDFFSQHFPVKSAVVVKDPATKLSRGYGFVVLTDAQDATDAKEKLHGQKIDGRTISIEVAKHRERKSATHDTERDEREAALREERKPPKLIVRNLPWSIKKPEQLAALFRSYGKIYYCDLPQNKGKLSGFGFVTMRRKGAERALEAVNGKIVDGRTLAVDWAVSKQEWTNLQEHSESKTAEAEGALKKTSADSVEAGDASDKDKDQEEEEEDEDLRNFMKNFGDKLEEEEDNEGEDGDENEPGSEDEDVGQEADDEEAPAKPLMSDNSTTLFIRNLPFSTTDADLKSHFEQFGRVRYARIVMDRATDRPAGTGFVNFISIDDAKKCLKGAPRPRPVDASKKRSILQDELADEHGLYTIDGRILQVSQAVTKEEATRLTADGAAARDGKEKDKRRLYLLSEGTISNSSPLYSLLAPSEVKMREDSAAQRKKQIQSNPSLHISLTRLAVRNIPREISSKELKALAREAVVGFAKDVKEGRREALSKEELARGGDEDREAEHKRKEKGKGVVKQTKIVFENREGSKVVEGDGAGRSRGYGFIEYSSHRWALMGLRWLNGHAMTTAAGKTHRLLVEFAIENAQVVARRNERETKWTKGGAPEQERPNFGSRAPSRPNFGERGPHHPNLGDRGPHRGEQSSSAKTGKQPTGRSGADSRSENQDGRDDLKGVARKVLEQKIIGRKRIMRKKKANVR